MAQSQLQSTKICLTCNRSFDGDAVGFRCPIDDGLLSSAPRGISVGHLIAERYRLEKLIGHGGWGSVYRAFDLALGRHVAVKVLHERHVADIDRIRRFESEAKAASKIAHPNIVTIFDYGLIPTPFLVMEWLEGEGLDSLVAQRKLSHWKELVPIFIEIADALEAAHNAGFIHRDVKPSNVFVCISGGRMRAKLVDFGLVKETMTTQPCITQSGDTVGTPHYMSPEQCYGRHLDSRTDVYSFGCVMYEALCRRRPFDAPTTLELMNQHVSAKPRPLPLVNPEVPDGLWRVIARCLEKAPYDRYSSARELQTKLIDFWQSEGSGKDTASLTSATRLRAAINSNIKPAYFYGIVGGVAIITLSSAIVVALGHRSGENREHNYHVMSEAMSSGEEADELIVEADKAFRARNYARVQKLASEALKLEPHNSRAYLLRADSRRLLGDLDGAVADAHKSLEHDPDSIHARRILSDASLQRLDRNKR